MKITDLMDKLAKLYVDEVIRLYGVPVSIISDWDPRFTSRLWSCLQRAMVTKRMKEAQDRQKSYADRRRRPLEFQVGDKVFLKVAP
jgi:hypothetical protein